MQSSCRNCLLTFHISWWSSRCRSYGIHSTVQRCTISRRRRAGCRWNAVRPVEAADGMGTSMSRDLEGKNSFFINFKFYEKNFSSCHERAEKIEFKHHMKLLKKHEKLQLRIRLKSSRMFLVSKKGKLICRKIMKAHQFFRNLYTIAQPMISESTGCFEIINHEKDVCFTHLMDSRRQKIHQIYFVCFTS